MVVHQYVRQLEVSPITLVCLFVFERKTHKNILVLCPDVTPCDTSIVTTIKQTNI
jgi:hypothetical protein